MGPVYILYSNLFHPSQQEILSMWAHMSVGSKIVYSACFHLVNYLTNLISHSLIFLLVFFFKKKTGFTTVQAVLCCFMQLKLPLNSSSFCLSIPHVVTCTCRYTSPCLATQEHFFWKHFYILNLILKFTNKLLVESLFQLTILPPMLLGIYKLDWSSLLIKVKAMLCACPASELSYFPGAFIIRLRLSLSSLVLQ